MNYNMFQGNKVRLRAKTAEDAARFRLRIENGGYDTELDRLSDTVYLPNSYESRKDEIESEAARPNDWDRCNLVIETLDGTPVGGVIVRDADRTNGTFSYGLGIDREHWRKGYTSEAVLLLLRYYFGELRFHKCGVTVFDFNEGSKALHIALGFTEEGRLREAKFSGGRYYDALRYGMLDREYWALHKDKFAPVL